MATLTSDELTELRQALSKGESVVTWSKAEANAAFQAVEDWEIANASKRATAIETASPGKFTGRLKTRIASKRLGQEHKR